MRALRPVDRQDPTLVFTCRRGGGCAPSNEPSRSPRPAPLCVWVLVLVSPPLISVCSSGRMVFISTVFPLISFEASVKPLAYTWAEPLLDFWRNNCAAHILIGQPGQRFSFFHGCGDYVKDLNHMVPMVMIIIIRFIQEAWLVLIVFDTCLKILINSIVRCSSIYLFFIFLYCTFFLVHKQN
jgi:hypothetical protein